MLGLANKGIKNSHYNNIQYALKVFCFIDYAKAFNCVDHNKL